MFIPSSPRWTVVVLASRLPFTSASSLRPTVTKHHTPCPPFVQILVDGTHQSTDMPFGEVYIPLGALNVADSLVVECGSFAELSCYIEDGISDEKSYGDRIDCETLRDKLHATQLADSNLSTEDARRLGVVRAKTPLWPNGRVCFVYDAGFSAKQQARFQLAADYLTQTIQGIEVVPSSHASCQGSSPITIKVGSSCTATIGYFKSGMNMNLSDRCMDAGSETVPGSIVHELLHSLGLLHEHTNPEANVVILAEEGLGVSRDNYLKVHDAETKAYDPKSIMHYPLVDLCVPDRSKYPDIKFCEYMGDDAGCTHAMEIHCLPKDTSVGQRESLSPGDIATLNRLYPPAPEQKTPPAPEQVTPPDSPQVTPVVIKIGGVAINFNTKDATNPGAFR